MAENEAEDAVDVEEDAPPKGKSRMLLISLVVALLLGGGGFYAVYSGMIPLGGAAHDDTGAGDGKNGSDHAAGHGGDDGGGHDKPAARKYDRPAFVALEPFVISLGTGGSARHLRVGLTIEVVPGAEDGVTTAIPRINDVLNTYLRAVDQKDFEVPRAMMRLRAQMLRRVKLVSPPDSVRDLLFQEFVLN